MRNSSSSLYSLVILIVLLDNVTQLSENLLNEVEAANNLNEIHSMRCFRGGVIQCETALKEKELARTMIEIDGSILEGGGQILRNSLTLSVLTHTPIKIINIRANRSKPGLQPQHLEGLQLLRDMCGGYATGAIKGSTTVEFHPCQLRAGQFESLVKTAGSIALLLQVALPCCLFSPGETFLHLEGGTNADMAPQIDYVTEVFRPNLEKMGATFDFNLVKRGYFPRGGGHVEITVQPVRELKAIVMDEIGSIAAIYGWSFVTGRMDLSEAAVMARNAESRLAMFQVKVDIEVYREEKKIAPIGDAAGIILVAETSTGCILGGSGLRNRSNTAEQVGAEAAEELAESLKRQSCVDDHCQDQLIIFMALAKGKSRIKVGNITMHTKTAIHIAELLTKAKFNIHGESNIIECIGIGHRAQHVN